MAAHAAGVAEAEIDIVASVDIPDMRAMRFIGIDRKAAGPAPHPVRRAAIKVVLPAFVPGRRRSRMQRPKAFLLGIEQAIQNARTFGGC
ncbi:hypothetical protein [Bradyrhizobium sp. USDA 4350]